MSIMPNVKDYIYVKCYSSEKRNLLFCERVRDSIF